MTKEGEDADALTETVLAALDAVDPTGIQAVLEGAENHPAPAKEQRIGAEEIARRIHEEQRRGPPLGPKAVAKIVRSAIRNAYEAPVSRKDAKKVAEAICARRLFDLVVAAVEEGAAAALTEGSAELRLHQDLHGFPAIELTPKRRSAASLLVSIDYSAQVTCMLAKQGYAHEVYSTNPTEIATEVQELVRSLVAGSYSEEARDKAGSTTTKAIWPGGGSSTLDVSADAGGIQTEWRRRDYEPY
jgi:hypothetical protein